MKIKVAIFKTTHKPAKAKEVAVKGVHATSGLKSFSKALLQMIREGGIQRIHWSRMIITNEGINRLHVSARQEGPRAFRLRPNNTAGREKNGGNDEDVPARTICLYGVIPRFRAWRENCE